MTRGCSNVLSSDDMSKSVDCAQMSFPLYFLLIFIFFPPLQLFVFLIIVANTVHANYTVILLLPRNWKTHF